MTCVDRVSETESIPANFSGTVPLCPAVPLYLTLVPLFCSQSVIYLLLEWAALNGSLDRNIIVYKCALTGL